MLLNKLRKPDNNSPVPSQQGSRVFYSWKVKHNWHEQIMMKCAKVLEKALEASYPVAEIVATVRLSNHTWLTSIVSMHRIDNKILGLQAETETAKVPLLQFASIRCISDMSVQLKIRSSGKFFFTSWWIIRYQWACSAIGKGLVLLKELSYWSSRC